MNVGTEKRPFFYVLGRKITIDLDEAERAARDKVELGVGVVAEIADDSVLLGNKILGYLRGKAAAAREKMDAANTPPTSDAPTDSDVPTP